MLTFIPNFISQNKMPFRRMLTVFLSTMIFGLLPVSGFSYTDLRMQSPVVKAVQSTKDAVVNISSEY